LSVMSSVVLEPIHAAWRCVAGPWQMGADLSDEGCK
jgi:hypothetical protein